MDCMHLQSLDLMRFSVTIPDFGKRTKPSPAKVTAWIVVAT